MKKGGLNIIFLFIFIQIFGQIPKVSKSFSLNPTINYFIENQPEIKPNTTVIVISLFLNENNEENEKEFMLDITSEYIKLRYDKKPQNIYENYKYKNFDVLLIGQNHEQIKFLQKIIKNLKPANNTNLEFVGTPKTPMTNAPYSWYFNYDINMNLKNIYITEDITTEQYAMKIKKIEKLNKK